LGGFGDGFQLARVLSEAGDADVFEQMFERFLYGEFLRNR
jgi:hypothetical protein